MLTSPRLCPALASLLAAVAVAAQAQTVRLQVEAPPDCTTREELMAQVAARTRRFDFAAPGDESAAPLVRVVVTPGPRAVVGELTITQPEGSPAVRRLSAPSCEQLTDALALVIALVFDRETAVEPAAPSPEAQRPKPPPPPPPAPLAPASVAVAPAPEPAPIGHLRVSAAAGGQVLLGPAPRAMPGVTVELTVSWDRTSVWSPAARLSASAAWSGALHETGGVATFSLDTLTLDACPLRLLRWRLEVRACATGTVGRLRAQGSETYQQASVERPFAATGGAAVLTLPLGHALEVSARASAGASWIRDSFAFAPKVFYRGAPLFVAAGLTAGVRFR
jgi:hypothetical protein